jgi:hypothetical protein
MSVGSIGRDGNCLICRVPHLLHLRQFRMHVNTREVDNIYTKKKAVCVWYVKIIV